MTSLFDFPAPADLLTQSVVSDLLTLGSRSVTALSFFGIDEAVETVEEAGAAVASEQVAAPDVRALQVAAMIAAAREDAGEQARLEMQVEWDLQQQRERARSEHLTVEFARDRRRYFAAAEGQVVKLAVAIAEHILAREVAESELPLAATARAALARVQDGSQTTLHVGSSQAEQWRGFFADEPRISISEDARLAVDDCVLETRIGRIDLGLKTQLEEIERGFDDLLARTGD